MRIAIIGRTEILYETVELLRVSGHTITCILTAKETPEYTKTASDFKYLATILQVPFANTARIESQVEMLRKSNSEVAVSINFSVVIPQSITDLFPFGILNSHGGDLPRYRGNACQAWAILNGEDKIGLCIHRMIGGELDNGDIIERDYLPIDHNTKITDVYSWFSQRIPELFAAAINRLTENPKYVIDVQSIDPVDALRCYPRKPVDGRIDWRKSALQILRLINASNKPYAGAFCSIEGNKFIIWNAELVEEYENFLAVPGQITRTGDGFVEVACGEGKLRILLAEYEGEVDTPNTWIKSIRMRVT
jgi:methionyl-tRNA formyltransferase